MPWQDQLQNGGVATWRGVPFELESHTGRFGRRTVRHEYPQRNKPFIEDMGRRTREFTLKGFVQGDDYFGARDALIIAAEVEGSGTLVHPYLGTLTVTLDAFDVTESTRDGRMARFSFSFIETGDLTFPTPNLDTADAAILAAGVANLTASAQFVDDFDTDGEPGFVVDSAEDQLAILTTRMRDAVQPFFGAVEDFAEFTRLIDKFDSEISTLVGTPSDLADDVVAIFVTIGNLDVLQTLHASSGTEGPLDATTAADLKEQENTEAILRLQVQAALAAAVTTTAGTTFTVFDDAIETRDELAERIALEQEIAGGHDNFVALVDLRVELVEFIDAGSQNLPRLETINVLALTPSVVLAWDLYKDATRDAEINDRNRVRNPLFLSPETDLQVLTS